MVGVLNYVHWFGTVAVFATLFAAIHVNGENGCVYDFEHDNLASDFDLECEGLKNSWEIKEVETDTEPSTKKALVLSPEQEGCLKTKNFAFFNSTLKLACKFQRDTADEKSKFTIRLTPKDGECPVEECVWNVDSDPQFKAGKWVTVEHSFPLKATKEYYVQLQIGKGKGKFLLDHISVPNVVNGRLTTCRRSDRSADLSDDIKIFENPDLSGISISEQLVGNGSDAGGGGDSGGGGGGGGGGSGGGGDDAGGAPSFMQISKNLLITSASVLTLNHLLN